jgi:hypothetical protein
MAIVTFAPAGIITSEISEVAVTTPITAQVVTPFTPPVVNPVPSTQPGVSLPAPGPLEGPSFQWPPNQGPVSNIIVEGPTQRGENNFPWSGIALTRQLPPESNPYRMLPENYIMEQWGEYLPPQYRTEFYNLERPLDLLRYKSDRYWNVLSYQGGYALNQGEVDIIPFASLTYVSVNNRSDKWEIRAGSIVTAFEPVLRIQMGATNFLGIFTKEVIRLEANYNVFSASAPTSPPPPQTWEDARRPTTATNFGERTRRELGRGRFRGDLGGGFTGGGIGGGGYS